ncbi:MAG: glucose-1-phosphate thymidylyltransferase RfbA [Lentisphaerae bacterium]|nr:glucose-1-phosphate thymidylyltransferase RfbA [Lentisphaerota bacterium]
MKGIILAGGAGSRLHPVTKAVSKQLLPVYDKPMIYYPLSVLMLAGIRDILIITTPEDQAAFQRLLGNGVGWGVNLSYAVQPSPDGLAQAFIIGKDFIGQDQVALVLGDNIFYGAHLSEKLLRAAARTEGATVFGCRVADPERFGVMQFDENNRLQKIVEKPAVAPSVYAVTGLYFYDNEVVSIAGDLRPSARGELEITDVNNEYLRRGKLNVELLGRGFAWLDTGTPESLLDAGNFIHTVQTRQGVQVACLEEIAYQQGFIGRNELEGFIASQRSSKYAEYLQNILDAGEINADN